MNSTDRRKLTKCDVWLFEDQYGRMKRLASWRQEELKARGIEKRLTAADLIRSAIEAYIDEYWPDNLT